jgi:hypothetical protein
VAGKVVMAQFSQQQALPILAVGEVRQVQAKLSLLMVVLEL